MPTIQELEMLQALDHKTKNKKTDLRILDSVRTVVEDNKAQRHIRGGQSTKHRYMKA